MRLPSQPPSSNPLFKVAQDAPLPPTVFHYPNKPPPAEHHLVRESPQIRHLQTPALLITPSNSSLPTPFPTPAPPFASRIISLSTSSLTSSARSSAATRFRCASMIGLPPANSANASSTSASCAATDGGSRACSLSAQMPTKDGYVAKPSSSGSRIEMKSASSDLEEGGMPRALEGGGWLVVGRVWGGEGGCTLGRAGRRGWG